MLRTAVMLNAVRRHLTDYDIAVTANNEADFGKVGVQYALPVEHVSAAGGRPALVPPRISGAYYRLCVGLSDSRRTRCAATSRW
jgi:hypothetical protein